MANGKWVVIAAVVVILILGFFVLMHPSIGVTGTVRTTPLTQPVTIMFTGGFGTYSTSINSDGHYSISLMGGNSYNVTVIYSAAISSGSNSCSAGVAYIPTTPSTYIYNPAC